MARYLTPAKISLLALIELYTDSAVPTASTIPILSFIISHLLPSSLPKPENSFSGVESKSSSQNPLISIKDFERLLSNCPAAAGLPGRSLWDLLLKKLWDIDSLDALHMFFEQIYYLLVRTREDTLKDTEMGIPPPVPEIILLSRTSPLGVFVRRSRVEFTRLKFHDAVELWKGFIAFRQVTLQQWRRRYPSANHWSFDVVLEEGLQEWEGDTLECFANITYGDTLRRPENAQGSTSTDDIEKLLEFQIEHMQKLGSRLPDVMQDRLRGVLNGNVMVPSISHYVRFLDAWKAGDYPNSFDNLHRFFDYTMQSRDRLFYQYALLNLAVLQADFGCFQEAIAVMQETVSTARENKDMACLNFSLSWLYHFGKAHPKAINETDKTDILGVEREGLAFLRTKAKEYGMWSLWSSSLLSEAKMGLSSGESVAAAFENIMRSSQLTVTKNSMNTVGTQMLLQSSMWSRLGVTHLARSYCEVFLRCHSRPAPFDDVLKFTCRAAYLLAQRGRYDEAMAKLEQLDANSLRSLKAHQYWLLFRGVMRLKRDIYRNNLDGADQLLAQLLQCRGGDPDLAYELNTLHIETMTRRGDYSGALAKIESLSMEFKDNREDIFFRANLLVTKALLFDKCGRPQKGFSIAVRAASIAWRARLLPVLWYAVAAIANILTSLEEFEAAAQVLAAVIPRAIECEDCALTAQLFSFLVDAHMGMAGQASPGSLKRTENLTRALDFLDRAFTEYASIEDVKKQCEMMAKKAMVMQVMGDPILANDYAAAYLDMKKAAAQVVQ